MSSFCMVVGVFLGPLWDGGSHIQRRVASRGSGDGRGEGPGETGLTFGGETGPLSQIYSSRDPSTF